MMRYVLEPAGVDGPIAQGKAQLAEARAQFKGPEELLERLRGC